MFKEHFGHVRLNYTAADLPLPDELVKQADEAPRIPTGIKFTYHPTHITSDVEKGIDVSIVLHSIKEFQPERFPLLILESSNNSRASFEIARSWLRDCQQNHINCLKLPTVTSYPSKLIYLGTGSWIQPQLQLTYGLPLAAYATLSHCWGYPFEHLILKNESINAFLETIPLSELRSKTFFQAMTTARRLGIYYIWIDSLCIIQDDHEDWKKESVIMEYIYQGSTINIVATHAESGEKGLFVE
ncbi:heterokaryon incompatibility protein-domain-containing protein [Xylariaceae sp. FL0255]|nr:heterokaryon incompatibility protein-domain-containing protein [Xylariaceae sp. FL0255]